MSVPAGGMTLTRLLGELQRNMGDRTQQIVEMGLTVFNVAALGALAIMPTGAGGPAEQMSVDVRNVMLVCSEDKNATTEMMQRELQKVATNWQMLAHAKLPFKEGGRWPAPALLRLCSREVLPVRQSGSLPLNTCESGCPSPTRASGGRTTAGKQAKQPRAKSNHYLNKNVADQCSEHNVSGPA
jgi:hypothetical protein